MRTSIELLLIFAIKCINTQTVSNQLVPDCESLLSLNLTKTNHLKDINLPKCYCDRVSNKSDQDIQINCVHLTDLKELIHAIASVNNSKKNLVEIHIRGFNLTGKPQKPPTNIPDKFFATILPNGKLQNLKAISLTDCVVGDWKNKDLPLSTVADLFKFGKDIFHGLEKSLKSLKIRNCPNLDQILNLTRNLNALDTLELSNVNLKSINKGDLNGFQNLKSLDISHQETSIESGSLDSLKSLQQLKLSKLGLNASIIDDLKTLTSLKTLDLSGNNIRYLPDKAFSALKALTNLILNFNYIASLDDNTFDGLNQLNKLDLRVNLLSNISKDAFSKMSNLKELLLAGNYISNFGAHQPQSLQQLDLSHNELTKIDKQIFGSLKKLEKLNLDKNEHLSAVDTGTFDNLKNLKSLNLSFTNLSSIFDSKPTNILDNLINLITLDLSGLGLKSLNGNFLTGLKNLKNLYLRSNDLETVSPALLKPLSNVKLLDASQNPWQCDSHLKDFASLLKKLSSQDSLSSKIEAALCAFPPTLKGLPVMSAKIEN